MGVFKIVDGVYQGPSVIQGGLNFRDLDIKSLNNLETVHGKLEASGSSLEDLGALSRVNGYLDISGTNVKSLGNLSYVKSHLYLGMDVLILDLHHVGGSVFYYFDDFKERRFFLKDLRESLLDIKPMDFPMHIHSENPYIRNIARHYLETGILPKFYTETMEVLCG